MQLETSGCREEIGSQNGGAMRRRLVIVLAVGVVTSMPLFAHHGGAAFDAGKMVTLKGTVTQWIYSNPHCLLSVDVKGDDGKIARWLAETQAPGIMYPAGYRREHIQGRGRSDCHCGAGQEWSAGWAYSQGRHC